MSVEQMQSSQLEEGEKMKYVEQTSYKINKKRASHGTITISWWKIVFSILIMLSIHHLVAQNKNMDESKLPVIETGDAEFIRFNEIPFGMTNSIPPHVFYKIDSYVFEITFTVSYDGNSISLDSLFGLVCILPDYSILKLKMDVRNLIYLSPQKEKYTFLLETKKEGWLKIMLASNKEMQSDDTPEFYRYKSNTFLIYLGPPH